MTPIKTYYQSPLGTIELITSDNQLIGLYFIEHPEDKPAHASNPDSFTQACIAALDNYFSGSTAKLTIPTAPAGTPFQKKVWHYLTTIPFGTTCSYSDIADKIGNPTGVRAVATAISKNPIAIIIPCHRVIGKTGKLTGYSGGLWRKKWLLDHEKITHEKNSKI